MLAATTDCAPGGNCTDSSCGGRLACCACAIRPQEKISAICNDCEQRLLNTSGSYPLSAYLRNMSSTDQHSLVHVYLEGDGRPWIRGKIPASNPTSRELTALRLMMLDQQPSVYLNRPCYGLNSMPTNCGNHLWTADRYSNDVIAVLNQALDQLQRDRMIQKWLLIGHSGGGSVAMLLAQRGYRVLLVGGGVLVGLGGFNLFPKLMVGNRSGGVVL